MEINSLDIVNFRKKNNLTQKDLAKLLGVSHNTIYNYENNGVIPKSKITILVDLIKNYKDLKQINVQDPFQQFHISSKNGHEIFNLPDGSYLMKVPLFPIDVYARYISEGDSIEPIEGLEYVYFNVDVIGKGNYRGFRVKGDSFWNEGGYDTPDKGIVLAREVGRQHWKDGFRNSPYGWVIFTKNNGVLKDIIKQDLQNGIITCHSRNTSPEYSDFNLSLDDDVVSIWRVIKRQF